ncbi:coiled-coil domain-containing protein 13-like isoform X2 [Xenia sp. Carnegie-2017]|uniref:coiled-coil domain-containing protein 13-like isoform X2 n=1 Tax=Xenia sp. Carnegie-2017 TaxID=2897299 RepID=UPI001F04B84A|nr:coiled-coil domain-containing protein 13-like isoform X2 [Xenia sp. Carnegie-2017]
MNVDRDTASSLRQQFELIQKQHQKKLLLRKQQQITQSNKDEKESNSSNPEQNAGGQSEDIDSYSASEKNVDNLELKLNDDLSARSSIQMLEYDDKLRELKDENGRLYKLLAEKDEEMKILNKQITQERQAIAGIGPASDTAANKIMELSKRNRELGCEVEKEKRRAKQLSTRLNEIESQHSSLTALESKKDDSDSKTQEKSNAQVLEEKLKQALSKMAEYRNQCEILKKEAKVAHKVITKECGEGVNVAGLLNEPSGWRGRQQQITTLQNKVNELKAQYNEVTLSSQTHLANKKQFTPQRTTTPSFYDEKHKQMLRKMERDKKEEHERVSGELQLLNEQHSKLQTKFDASKTRNKILSSELKGMKEQMKMLVEKGNRDDELISALMREQQRLKNMVEKKNSQIAERESACRQEKVQQDNELVKTLTQLCKEREEKVTQLERQLKRTEFDLSEKTTKHRPESLDKATSTELASDLNYSPLSEESLTNELIQPKSEIDIKHDEKTTASSREKTDSPSIPSRSGAWKRKTNRQTNGGRRERDVQESNSKILSEIKTLQRQNMELEKKVTRAQGQGKHSYKNLHQKTRTKDEHNNEPFYVEELETQLAIQKDENDALREALESTLVGKKDDFEYYQSIVEQTKRVFLQGLNQYRNTSSMKTKSKT